MRKNKKIIIISVICFSLMASTLSSFTPMTVYAKNTIGNENIYMKPIDERDYVENKSTRTIFTKIAKTALKKAIKNKARLIDFVEDVAGKKVAKNVDKFFNPITKALKPLLEWSEIPAQAVYDAVFRAIINAGGSRAVAANVANAIREVLEWTLF